MGRLRPFVFRRYLDYGSFNSLRGMKAMITSEVQRKGLSRNIKLGAGGIREIEFFGQIFQLMRGGVEPVLQCRRLRDVLVRLGELGLVPTTVGTELDNAYCFLRNTEHRLQEMADQQTHDLPTGTNERLLLAGAMGFETAEAFDAVLEGHRSTVHAHFQQLLEPREEFSPSDRQRRDDDNLTALWLEVESGGDAKAMLAGVGFDTPDEVFRQLIHLKEDPRTRALSHEGRSRLDRLIPLVLKAARRAESPDHALGRMLEIIGAIQQRTNYLALLIENPAALDHLTRLAAVSPWIVSFLSRHPVLLDELLDPRTLYTPPAKAEMAAEIQARIDGIGPDDLEYQIEELCIFKQVNTLRVAAADITGALPLMRTSDYLTDIAEVVLANVVELAWRHLVEKHGRPSFDGSRLSDPGGFVIIGYGKLGGIELGYGSDLDMVFLHAADAGSTDGARPVDNAQFYARLGQRIVHILTTHTRAGRLYEVDMRLRPSGSGGILVSHVEAYRSYQESDAWTWEHQALIRARPITGDPHLSHMFSGIRTGVITEKRNPEALRREVLDMREKMRREASIRRPGWFDVKQDSGGIVDIEFMVQYLVLMHAHRHPELARWSDNVRQLETLTMCGVITPDTEVLLKSAYLDYRASVHLMNLRGEPAHAPEEKFRDLNRQISILWKQVMEASSP
jgi:glutamate-ammonia-ligase adenylyltransferase